MAVSTITPQATTSNIGRGGPISGKAIAKQHIGGQNARSADAHAGRDEHQGFPGHDPHDRRTPRAKRHAHAELPGSSLDAIGEQAVEAGGGQHQRDRREAAHQQHEQPRRRHAACKHLIKRAHAVKRDLGVHARGDLPKRRDQRLGGKSARTMIDAPQGICLNGM